MIRFREYAESVRTSRYNPAHWSTARWMQAICAVVATVAMALAYQHGQLARFDPSSWTVVQWALVVVSIAGFSAMYLQQGVWLRRQDNVWDEVDQLRAEVASLREELYDDHLVPEQIPDDEGDPTEGEDDPTEQIDILSLDGTAYEVDVREGERWDPTATGPLPTVPGIPSARPKVPSETHVRRTLGGREFTFRKEAS